MRRIERERERTGPAQNGFCILKIQAETPPKLWKIGASYMSEGGIARTIEDSTH
jgi:hypothetical protein